MAAQSKWHPDELKKLKPGKRVWENGVGYYRHREGDGGTWLVRYRATMPDGSRLRVTETLESCRNITEARDALAGRKTDAARGVWRPLKAVGDAETFANFAEVTFPKRAATRADPLRASTLKSYKTDIELHLVPFFGKSVTLGGITTARCKEYYRARTQVVARATANNELNCLKSVFAEAIEAGLVASNPAAPVKAVRANNERVRRLTDSELTEMFTAAATLWAQGEIFVWLLYWTGMRFEEAQSIEWYQVNFELKLIDLPKTKTGNPRTVPIRRELLPKLERWFDKHGDQPWVFPGKPDADGETSMVSNTPLRNAWKLMLERAGVTDVTPHDLRHHFAKRLIDEGLEPRIVMRVMGWRSWQMLRRYVLASDDEVREAIEALGLRDPTVPPPLGNAKKRIESKKRDTKRLYVVRETHRNAGK